MAALRAENGWSAYAGTCTNGGHGATAGTGRSASTRGHSNVIDGSIARGNVLARMVLEMRLHEATLRTTLFVPAAGELRHRAERFDVGVDAIGWVWIEEPRLID